MIKFVGAEFGSFVVSVASSQPWVLHHFVKKNVCAIHVMISFTILYSKFDQKGI